MTSTVRAGLIGAGIGGATMFLLDPDRGAPRRALIRNKVVWGAPSDRKLTERVRAALGRVTSHPRAIGVEVSNGCVCLMGDALASEVDAIISAVSGLRGVECVQSELCAFETANGIPTLQGESSRPGRWSGWTRGNWSASSLLCAGLCTGTAALAIAALGRRASP